MKGNVLDRRVKKTRKQLRECLASLLREKKLQDITVKELTDAADINRGTFYLHYKDIYDLLSSIEDEMFEKFVTIINSHDDEKNMHRKFSHLLDDMFEFIGQNHDLVRILLGPNGDITFFNKLKDTVRSTVSTSWLSRLSVQNFNTFEAYYSFSVAGFIGLLSHWIECDFVQSPKEMSDIAKKLIIHGYYSTNRKNTNISNNNRTLFGR